MRRLTPLLALAALAVAVLISNLSGGAGSPRHAREDAPLLAGSPTAYTYLAAQRSNRCSLQAREIFGLKSSQHLQGACCTSMDGKSYRRQVHALRRYRALAQIPRDPYDISVGLAKQLLSYQAHIRLGPAQQRTYAQAMRLSPEHGPCCCHCWRWETMQGLSEYLIVAHNWRARAVATLIGDLDGCGGAAHAA